MSIFDKIRRLLSDDEEQDPKGKAVTQPDEGHGSLTEPVQTVEDPAEPVSTQTGDIVSRPTGEGAIASETTDQEQPTAPESAQPVLTEEELQIIMTDDRILAEARMCTDGCLRACEGNVITLGDYLGCVRHISPYDIDKAYVLVNKNITNIADPRDYNLIQDILPAGLKRSANRPDNVILDIALKGVTKLRGTTRVIINMSAKGDTRKLPYRLIKLSYTVFKQSGNERGVDHIIYEQQYSQQLIDKIQNLWDSAVEKNRKGEPLNDQERLIIGAPRLQDELRRAEVMMRFQRWTDAIAVLVKVYGSLRDLLLHKDTERSREMMLQAVMGLYRCHMALEQYDMALYYAELSAWLEGHPNKLFVEAMRKTGDIRILAFPPQPDNSTPKDNEEGGPKGRKRFSLILDALYGISPSDLSNMLIVKDGKTETVETISDPAEIWSFDMLARMRDCESLTAYMSLRSIQSEFSDDNGRSTDTSTNTADNVIIAAFDKETVNSRQCIKMTLMIPVTINADEYDFGTVHGVDLYFTTEKALDMPLFLDIRDEAAKKARNEETLTDIEYMAYGNLTEARYNMVLGANASNRGIWGDVIYYLTRSYRLMAWSALLGAPDENAEDAIYNLCYKIGFAYCELKLYPLAISYLARIAHVPYIPYQIEYINALCNSRDIRAIEVIKNRMDSYPEKLEGQPASEVNQFMKFLKRRYAYMLIECDRIKEAREYLQKLLGDDHEETRRFANSELEYLNQKYPQDGSS